MNVKQLSIKQFTAFEHVFFEFSPGINVFIGTNSTGKTHVIKLMYSLLKVCEWSHLGQDITSRDIIEQELAKKLQGVFQPERTGRLVRRKGRGNNSSIIDMTYADLEIHANISSRDTVTLDYGHVPKPVSPLYIPPHEFLSKSEGFIAAYTNRESSFDETYYDLSVALDATLLRGPRLAEIRDLIDPLENAINGNVINENGRFYVKFKSGGKYEAPLVSEGFRKIAELIYLINNGSLTKNGILFWDEPEANLNPKMTVLIVDLLKILASRGVQIFVATHDYLFSQELSLLTEYPSDTHIKFFSFYKPNKRAGVIVESAETLVEIERNPILDEFAAHYDREAKLFQDAGVEG